MTTNFRVTNITCEACVKLCKMALEDIPSVTDVRIDEATGAVELVSDQEIEWSHICSELESVGKKAVKIQ